MAQNITRPMTHLRSIMKKYPETGKLVDYMMEGRGKELPDWPNWCFMPIAGWISIVTQREDLDPFNSEQMRDIGTLAALGTWRYSLGIYRLSPELFSALVNDTIMGSIPSQVLYRLPEWCVYVETPGLSFIGSPLYGFWAHLEFDINTHRSELRFLMDCEDRLLPIPLHLGDWTVTEAVDRFVAEGARQSMLLKHQPLSMAPEGIEKISADVNPLLSLLLYLCSEEPEVDDERRPGTSPSKAKATRTRRGWKMFPADTSRVWRVGYQVGERLREGAEEAERRDREEGRTVRPHLRRAHWHGFWTGPRDGKRKFVYKWIPPLFIGGGE